MSDRAVSHIFGYEVKDAAAREASANNEAAINAERQRIDVMTTLPEGSTTGDAELQDIRAGYNNASYPNAGAAVRGQASGIARFMQHNAYFGSEVVDLSAATFVPKSYIKSDGTIQTNNSMKYTEDFFEIKPNWEALSTCQKVTLITGTDFDLTLYGVIFYAEDKTSTSAVAPIKNGDIWTFNVPGWAKYARFNLAVTSPMNAVWIHKYKDGKVGDYVGTFETIEQVLNTGIMLRKGQKYLIRKNRVTEGINAYCSYSSSYYARMRKQINEAYLTPTGQGELRLFNPATFGYTGKVDISVYLAEEECKILEKPPKVYTVGKDTGMYDYKSFTQCLLDLKSDKTPKIIFINEGDYDIYQEYKDASVPVYTGDSPTFNYYNYNVWVPENTHIIGRGIVKLNWMPDPAKVELTYNESVTVSPLNCAATATIENIEIHCKNGRYCIHDDPLGNDLFTNSVKKYINVRCYKYENDDGFGWKHTIGFGVDRTQRYEFHNCLFKNTAGGRAFYMHDRKKVGVVDLETRHGSNVVVTNCVMDTNGTTCVKLGNSESGARIRTDFNSCWFSGKIDIQNESSSAGVTYPNSWDLKLCLCNNVPINIKDTANKYPPAVYGYTGV